MGRGAIAIACVVCGRLCYRSPGQLRWTKQTACSRACMAVAAELRAESEHPLARFDPGPPLGPHDAWIDAWRRRRAEQENAPAG